MIILTSSNFPDLACVIRLLLRRLLNEKLSNLVSAFCSGIPSKGRVKCSYIEKESIPTVWTV